MSRALKGGQFEREICKLLSDWWTDGKRDDVFWRSSQSGGRATQRAKSGKRTYGSYGDVAAVDPIGEPLMKFATIELKRGSSHGVPWDLIESAPSKAVRVFEGALAQAKRSAMQAQSIGWMLIARRDRKRDIVYLDWRLYRRLGKRFECSVTFNLFINQDDDFPVRYRFVAIRLKEWLQKITKRDIIRCLHEA